MSTLSDKRPPRSDFAVVTHSGRIWLHDGDALVLSLSVEQAARLGSMLSRSARRAADAERGK